GMGCKAQTTAIAVAMARICNAADRPTPQMHTARRLVQTILKINRLVHRRIGFGLKPRPSWRKTEPRPEGRF
ncbi:MAG: hypothetical protein FWF12_05980, partial [Betaproteobacteria bacterium]|nr:hypothetical protein [Betaproteobacteria bacterium]